MSTPWQSGSPSETSALTKQEAATFWLKTLVIVSLFAVIAMSIVAYARSRKDYQAIFDLQLEEQWLSGRELTNAAKFFSAGGQLENSGSSQESIDQKYVRPLITQLEERHGLEMQVLLELDDAQHAYALVAEVPADRATRNAIRTTVLETAEQFPGLLYQNWGHRWMTLEFFDEVEITPLKQAGVLAKLKASQRKME